MAAKFRAAPHHRRHYSWPPIRLLPSHLQHHTSFPSRPALVGPMDIDDDPFAYFVSSPSDPDQRFEHSQLIPEEQEDEEEEEEAYISDWMNANIEESASQRRQRQRQRRTRSVSPFGRGSRSPLLHRRVADERSSYVSAAAAATQIQRPASPTTAIVMLRGWLDRMEKMYFHKKPGVLVEGNGSVNTPYAEKREPFLAMPISPPLTPGYAASSTTRDTQATQQLQETQLSPLRGRKRVRRSSRSVGNRAVRSYAGHRRVWREPSEDMYPLSEEDEYEEVYSPMSI